MRDLSGWKVLFPIGLLGLLVAGWAIQPVIDPDTWWHLRVGEYIVDKASLPQTDFISRVGFEESRPWVAYSWLYETGLAIAFDHLGLYGIVLLRLVAVLVVTAVVMRLFFSHAEEAVIPLAVALAWVIGFLPFCTERPWHASVLLCAATLHVLGRDDARSFAFVIFVAAADVRPGREPAYSVCAVTRFARHRLRVCPCGSVNRAKGNLPFNVSLFRVHAHQPLFSRHLCRGLRVCLTSSTGPHHPGVAAAGVGSMVELAVDRALGVRGLSVTASGNAAARFVDFRGRSRLCDSIAAGYLVRHDDGWFRRGTATPVTPAQPSSDRYGDRHFRGPNPPSSPGLGSDPSVCAGRSRFIRLAAAGQHRRTGPLSGHGCPICEGPKARRATL